MNEELRKVLHGFNKLSASDKRLFVARLGKQTFEGGALNESVEKGESISMGPLGSSCPCCGK